MALSMTKNGSDPGSAQGWTVRLIVGTILMAMVLEALSLGTSMVSIGLPDILKAFPTTQGGWLTTVYFLVGAVCAPLLGKTADLYGKRRVLLITMMVSGVGALICAVAPNFTILLIGRVLQGPILATLSLIPSFVRDIYPPKQAAFAASITVTGMGAFSLAAPTVIGWLLANYGFRGMFLFDAIWTLGLCVAIWVTLPESKMRRETKPDLLGGLILAGAVLPVMLYVSMGRTWGWLEASPLLLIGIALGFLFVRHTRNANEPIINLSLFRRKPLVFVAFAGAISYSISASIYQLIPLLAMTSKDNGGTYGLGLNTIEFSGIATPKQLATVIGGVVIGFLLARGRNPRIFLTLGVALFATALISLALAHDTFATVMIGSLLLGLAGGVSNAAIPNLVMRATPVGDQGSTAGTVQLCTTGASSILPVVMFAVLAPYMMAAPEGGVFYQDQGITMWLWISAAICVVALVVGATVLRERRGESFEEFSVNSPNPASDTADGVAPPAADLEANKI
ncbi:MFS transporter [Rhodococcus globerulus]|uniref:MFS transporter n=2 Tax=Nocardiaceae TaxID=85025 RepID=A0A652YHF0_NOCGL|nr:MFS transporter [Rhodococcus globerulus]MCE4265807.1 MFS transporter [Rhodococcus globerulus]PVX63364.1 MFS transporter [Rhodococcus globerulus]QXV99830.1 MFS transporter [Rhodococcus globerulus]